MKQRLSLALVRWRVARAANPSPLCWLRACRYYRHRAALAVWLGRPELTHRRYHALASARCGNAIRPGD
jgi:hypothetical protein